MNKTTTIILAIILAVSVGATLAYAFQQLATVNNHGTIKTAYGLSANVTSHDWGKMNLHEEKSYGINVTNTGTEDITYLNYSITNIIGLNDFIVDWTGESQSLAVGASLDTTFSLEIVDGVNGTNFSFDLELGYS